MTAACIAGAATTYKDLIRSKSDAPSNATNLVFDAFYDTVEMPNVLKIPKVSV